MYKFLSLVTIIVFISSNTLLSQRSITDSVIVINEVQVIDKSGNIKVGSKVTRIDKAILEQNRTKSLAELLNDNSTINIKSMGQGALSTASFRGTSSNHTQVLWNGISLNSATLGSFDFSQVPIYFIDNVSLYHGGSAQQSGSGALGGSVNFTNNRERVYKPSISILSEYGSNNTVTGGGAFKISKNRFTSSTRGYYQHSDNDYRYLNKVASNIHTYENREKAEYKQAGVMQEFYYQTKRGDNLSLISWWQFDKRLLPQSIIASTTATEQTTSHNIRNIVTYDAVRENHRYKFTTAFLTGSLDYVRYFDIFSNETDNQSSSFVTKGDYEYVGFEKISLGTTLNYRYDQAKSSSYEDGKISLNTISIRAFAQFRLTQRLHFDADVTAESVNDDLHAIYNVSARYRVIDKFLTLKGSNSYNHRVPTLNDLFWVPGGNPDLKPENGFSWDISALTEPSIGNVKMKFEATYYHMDIKNWIMWIPNSENGYIWSPVNFSEVISQGIEMNFKLNFNTEKTKHTIFGNYCYAHSVDNSNRGDDAQGKQLQYIPRNKWNGNYEFWYKDNIWFNYNLSFTDVRFLSADEEYYTDAYFQHNAEIGGQLKLKDNFRLAISLKVDNIFDAYYESTIYYPMPLRMYRLKVTFAW